MMTNYNAIANAVYSGSSGQTADLVRSAIEEKYPADRILKEGLVVGMMEAEKRYRKFEFHDSEVLLAGEAMKTGLHILMTVIEADQMGFVGTVVIGTPEGDLRKTEKNVTSCLMRSMCVNVVDLGNSVSCQRFVDAAIETKARIILCCTSLTTFLPQMRSLVLTANQANIRKKTKILLAGGPVTEWFCKSIDADMYAPDPVRAAEMAAAYCKKTIAHP